MAAYTKSSLPSVQDVTYDQTRYEDATYDQYQTQAFSTQTDKFAQLNQQSFASNHSVAQYMPQGPAVVLSCQPASGVFGSKVFLKVSFQYDIFNISAPVPYFCLYFGSEKCPMQDVTRDTQDNTGFVYTCSADVPQLLVTGCTGPSVPLSLVVEGSSGEEIARVVAGSFQYLDGSGDLTRSDKLQKHDISATPASQLDQQDTSPKTTDTTHLNTDGATNNYDYPTQQPQYANAYPQTNDMITAYRSSSFADPHYPHRRSVQGWNGFNTPLPSSGRSSISLDGVAGRPSLTPLPMPSSSGGGTPQLIRTSTIANGAGSSGPYHPISLYSTKAVLKINGKLDTMTENWTQEEWDNRRRIVMFRKSQTGSTLTANFRPVPVNERPPNSICISCIYWQEKSECYVTSVDTIYLLEQLVAAPNRFSVEEKNRIRRNLEGFHPITVSKAKPISEEFFKLIMGFPNPKPRNIEKDVKVFPWKILEPALKKIIGKYSASPSSTLPPTNMAPPVNPSPYVPLPTPPSQGMSSQHSIPSHHGDIHSRYSVGSQHDAISSPRSLSGSQGGWTPYTTAPYPANTTRTMSPNLRGGSPNGGPNMRLGASSLPAVTSYDTRTISAGSYAGISHGTSATPPRWDTTPVTYSESYPSLTSQNTHAQSVYGATGYGDGTPRT
ncbi:Putative Transcriptional regulator Medusa [[Torrubiella] hemipterigena]|uniref:Putative Transcriptional regulator Medusa n=1 Tax=[Torrubiella] hemipterigena TaxID=1531966 RepID=A0A0A1SPX1_9HYPO|nr:Putative Transcriptional regulator Medusa [[Torrubiella] hemipterigena]